jgi:ABC-type uncharacterized transport system substrate-binding protein
MNKLYSVALALIVTLLLPLSTLAAETTRIFLVNSYNPEYFWSAEQHRGIAEAFEGRQVLIEEFFLDTKRNPEKEWLEAKVSECLKKIEAFSPDIIFTGDDNATKTIGKHFYGTDTPVVFYGVNAEPWEYGLVEKELLHAPGKNVTGILERHFYADAIYLIDTLNETRTGPFSQRIKTIYLVTDDSYTSTMLYKHLSTGSWQADKEIVFIPGMSTFKQYQKEIEKINKPGNSVFIYNLQTLKNDAGQEVNYSTILEWTRNNLLIPSIAFHGRYIEEGLMAGILVSGHNQALSAGKKGLQIIDGTPAGEIPIEPPSRGKVVINAETTRKLGMKIPISLLIGSTIYPTQQ